MPQRIHLIERANAIRPVGGGVHESGVWRVPHRVAEELIGGDIYFHKRQKEPSFFGGTILGFRVHEAEDEFRGRVIFRFAYTRAHRDVPAGEGGWSYEMKVV